MARAGQPANRVDVRQLESPLLPLAEQERYARVFRDMRSLEAITAHLKDSAGSLAGNLTDGLADGDFRPAPEMVKPIPETPVTFGGEDGDMRGGEHQP